MSKREGEYQNQTQDKTVVQLHKQTLNEVYMRIHLIIRTILYVCISRTFRI